MSDFSTTLSEARAAVEEMIAAAERAEPIWTVPAAPGKWSPAQVTEHIARTLEEGAHLIAGVPSKFPSFPAFVRPIVRALAVNRVVRKRAWVLPRAKTPRPFDPASGSDTPAAARERLLEALRKYEEACRACASRDGMVETGTFGRLSLESYVAFNTQHTRHHTTQIPRA